ncbi:hypothetical protein BS47DRAFT_1402552 [Hydnum rufescens UP504]|uniref:Uncharacterized protein n=1 Tax=Hydnum rufescens UP504 TaxID=1448309 RepID=A0A9P6ADD4_9AGAM|nr:hypothetical protein BS47DRAFT_1402552 [Hydnum rufescens UP504]
MAEVRELMRCFIGRDGVPAVVSVLISSQRAHLLRLTQTNREAATAILDDLVTETTKRSGPQPPTPTGSTPVESAMGGGRPNRVYVQVPPRNPILHPRLSKRTVRRRIRRKQHQNVVNDRMRPLNLEPVKTTTVSAPLGLAGSALDAAEFRSILRCFTRGSELSGGASGHEQVRAEILRRLAEARARINSQLDILEAAAIATA